MADQEKRFRRHKRKKNMDKLIVQLESILFLKGEPVSVEWLAKTLGKQEDEMKASLEQLSKRLENRGVRLVETAMKSFWRLRRNQPKF